MRIAAAALLVALTLGCNAQPSMNPSPLPVGLEGASGPQVRSESSDPTLVTVDFREREGILKLRFAADWDVRSVDIMCERMHYTNAWGLSFHDVKPPAPANDFAVEDYSRQLQEAGIYQCVLTREDNTPDIVRIRFSTASISLPRPPGGGGEGGFYVLGSSIEPYAMLAGAAVTCTGSTVTGDIGVSPGTSVTGIPGLCVHNGTITSTAEAADAQADLADAYNELSSQPCENLAASLNGQTVDPGVYCVPAATTNLTGTFTLSGAGAYTFIFPSTLITSTGSSVNLINGATCGGVNWVVGSSATINGGMVGNVIAQASISTTGASLNGRFLAQSGEVTITGSTISNGGCS